MEETAQVLGFIGDIYDAVLEPRLWTGVLERAASFVCGCAASIFWQDSIRNEGNVYYQLRRSPVCAALLPEVRQIEPFEHDVSDA